MCTSCLRSPKDSKRREAETALSFPVGFLDFAFCYLGEDHCAATCIPKDSIVKGQKGCGCSLGQAWGGSWVISPWKEIGGV